MSITPALCVLAMAVPLFVYSAWGWRNYRRPAGWPKRPARVVKSWLAEIEIDYGEGSIKGWEPRIVFSYAGSGGPKTGACLSLDEKGFQFHRHGAAQRFLGKYPPGAEVVVHVSPRGEAVLLAEVNWYRKSHFLAWAVLGLLLVALAAFFMAMTWMPAAVGLG
jgi:hypothetical protein